MDGLMNNALGRAGPLLLAAAGILIAGVSNGMETGLYRVNRVRLRLRADAGDQRARMLQRLVADLRGQIIVCLIGYNSGVYLTTATVTMMVAGTGWARDEVGVSILATAILTPIFFVFTDVTPKSVLTYEADRWMYRLAPVLRGAYGLLRVFPPLVPALKGTSTLVLSLAGGRRAGANPFHPRQWLRGLLREGAADGVITGYQNELVEKVLGLRDRLVRHVMIPISRVTSVSADTGRESFVRQLRGHSYSRLPVWEERRDHIVGIVHIRDVLASARGGLDLRELVDGDLVTVPPEMPVGQALFRMRRQREAMAVVREGRGRTLGILTIKDLVEEIVGELAVW
jgi:putative hemolysin